MTAKPLDLAQFEGHEHEPSCDLNHHYDYAVIKICDCERPALLAECKRQREQIAELAAALEPLATIPLEDFGHHERVDAYPLMAWNDHKLAVGQVKQARAALAKAKP